MAMPHAGTSRPVKPKTAKGYEETGPASKAKAKNKTESRQGKHFGLKVKKRAIKP